MIIPLDLGCDSYDIILERGALKKAGELLSIDKGRKVLVVTDTGVPSEYAETVADAFAESHIFTFPEGEKSKNFDTYREICQALCDAHFTRKDAVIAVGGGVVGDMAGFAAATYMRGIDFYNIPTTLLSQVDSSIGGKTAIDLGKIKNIIGAFHQPKKVIIDPDVLSTLPKRQIANGLAESIKMAANFDKDLFELFLKDDYMEHIEKIIEGFKEWSESIEPEPDIPVVEEVPTPLDLSELSAVFTGEFEPTRFLQFVAGLPIPKSNARIKVEVTKV